MSVCRLVGLSVIISYKDLKFHAPIGAIVSFKNIRNIDIILCHGVREEACYRAAPASKIQPVNAAAAGLSYDCQD